MTNFPKKFVFLGLVILFLAIVFGSLNFLYKKITARSIFSNNPHQIVESGLKSCPENLEKHVTTLASFSPRNHLRLDLLNKSAEYIESEFTKYCPSVRRQTFTVNNNEYSNIICLFGEEKDLVVIGAHYDADEESVGADDNASGIAGLIEIARLLKDNPSKENILLVAYTLEELPYFRTENMGSFRHAQYLKDNEISVKYMLSFEMIGYFSNEENSQKIPSRLLSLFYPTKGNFIAIIGRFNKDDFIDELDSFLLRRGTIPVYSLHAPESMLQAHSSDQLNYWKLGYEAAMVTDTGPYRNKNYHKTTDTPETLDYENMAKVVSGIYSFLAK